MMSRSLQRWTAAALVLPVALVGCAASSVKDHRSYDDACAITVRAQWEDDGESYYVGGLYVQIVRKVGETSTLVLDGFTATQKPMLVANLEPGHYRVVVQGGGIDKVAEEFDLVAGRRATVRVDVQAASASTGEQIGEGALVVAKVVGGVVAVVALVGVIGLLLLLDDDDEEEEEDCGHGYWPESSCPYTH